MCKSQKFFSFAKMFFAVIFTFVVCFGQKAPVAKKYGIKSGHVLYTHEGAMKGTEEFYFDNYGFLEHKLTDITVNIRGVDEKTKKLVIINRDKLTSIDLIAKNGSEILIPDFEKMIKESNGLVAEVTMTKIGAEKVGTENIIGKLCDVWEIKKQLTKIWLYKGIMLKTTRTLGGSVANVTATKIEENISIPKGKFQIPAGNQITKVDVNIKKPVK